MGAASPADSRTRPTRGLWDRQLDHYPDGGARIMFLGIVVLATVILYYELYVGGAVAPSLLRDFGMTFQFYVLISVVGNAVGAFSSIIAGLADRWGRANMVTYGLLLTGLLTLFGVPNSPNKWVFAILVVAIGFFEGIILVATPALVRDFSPQLGRASAMGFWTLGPVVGSLCVSVISSHTLSHLGAWQDQFTICGIAGLVVFLLAFFGLRELSPSLRDQLMVSWRDRALIEARAKGLDVDKALRRPWRQMLHLDVVGSAFAVSVLLLVYYAAVGFFVIYFTSIYGFSEQQANAIGNWFWGFDAAVLVAVGLLSDRVGVRKPFMVIGGIGAIVMTIIFLDKATAPHTTYYTFALIISLLASFLAIAYAPWMASFTETVERRNPALTATGLAVWGWTIRIVVAASALIVTFVVSSMNPLVDYGTGVTANAAKFAPELATVSAIAPSTLRTLASDPTSPTAQAAAVGEIATAFHVTATQAVSRLEALGAVETQPGFLYVEAHGAKVAAAAKQAPIQWQHWWWACVGGEVAFVLLIPLMVGRWSPRKAKQDAQRHEQIVEAEIARLGVGQTVSV